LSYQNPDFRQRQVAAAKAKTDLLEKFKSATSPDNVAALERRAARQAIVKAREEREAQREAARIAREKEAAELAALEAERIAQAEREAAEAAAKIAREAAEKLARAARERAEHAALLVAAEKSIRETKNALRKGGKKERREAWLKLTQQFEKGAATN
jgi:hypothetical protein